MVKLLNACFQKEHGLSPLSKSCPLQFTKQMIGPISANLPILAGLGNVRRSDRDHNIPAACVTGSFWAMGGEDAVPFLLFLACVWGAEHYLFS